MAAYNITSEKSGVWFHSDKELANVVLFQCHSEALLRFASAFCVILMLIGIPGNLTTIVALARCKKVRNTTAIFIINLHTSDLIFNSFILPMTAMTFAKRYWTHGWVMCRVYAYLKFVLCSCSLYTVVAISIIRYVIICHPLLYPKFYNRRTISISIMMIWASALAINMAPHFNAWGRFDLEPKGGFCTILRDSKGRTPKNIFIISIGLPYLIITFCYVRIWWVVKNAKITLSKNPRVTQLTQLPISQTQSDVTTDRSTRISSDPSSPESCSTTDSYKTTTNSDSSAPQSPREEKASHKIFKAPFRLTRKLVRHKIPTSRDKRLSAMIAAIMISFCISNLPVMVMRLAYKNSEPGPVLNEFTHLLQFSGTCMNPIIYVLMSKEYRQAYRSLFEAIIKKFRTQKLNSSQ